jgi:hypothetical protein
MSPVRTRLPRFQRSSDIPPLRLTLRDQEILKHVHRHRFLRSDHLTALTTGSPQQILRRLQLLYHHGYLDRPKCQIDYYHSGSRRMAYGIGNKGAGWLKRKLSLPYHKLDWKQKNHVGKLFLEHALLVSDVMVAVELACRKQPDVKFLMPGESTARKRDLLQWKVQIGNRIHCGVIPDRVFGLESNGKHCWYFLEADRATMPVTRHSVEQTSFQRKLLAYEATWTRKIHQRDLEIHRFRVLTVTTTPERVRKMIEACQQLQQGRGLFLFADIGKLRDQSAFSSSAWQTFRNGKTTGLLESN